MTQSETERDKGKEEIKRNERYIKDDVLVLERWQMHRHGQVLFALHDCCFEHVSDGSFPLHVHFSCFVTICSRGMF